MEIVPLSTIPENSAFLMPWRPRGMDTGKVIRQGPGSVHVHIPKVEGDGWERTHIAPATQVVPATLERYHNQGLGEGGVGGRVILNRSVAESPVQVVHKLCEEMPNASRDEIVKAAVAKGVNINTAKTQFYAWRRKNAPSTRKRRRK